MKEIFNLKTYDVGVYMNADGNLFWKTENSPLQPLSTLPPKYQKPFYIKFIQRHDLAEIFSDIEIHGAIDLYIKSQFVKGQGLELIPNPL